MMQTTETENLKETPQDLDKKSISLNHPLSAEIRSKESNSSIISPGIILDLSKKEDREEIISKHKTIRELVQPENDLLRVFETTQRGLGVIANQAIKEGTVICKYEGELIRQKTRSFKMPPFDITKELNDYKKQLTGNKKRDLTEEEQIKLNEFYDTQQKLIGNFATIVKKTENEIVTIRGDKKAGIASLMNASTGYENVKMVIKNNQIFFMAIQDIDPGEEILLDYGLYYFGSECFLSTFPKGIRSIETFLEQKKKHYQSDPVELNKEERELLGTSATHLLMPDVYLQNDTAWKKYTANQINHLPFIEVVKEEGSLNFKPLPNQQFITAMMFSSLNKDILAMERIVKKGVCVNFVTENGRSAWSIVSASYNESVLANKACRILIYALKHLYESRKWDYKAYLKYIKDNLVNISEADKKKVVYAASNPKKIKIKPFQFKDKQKNKDNNSEKSSVDLTISEKNDFKQTDFCTPKEEPENYKDNDLADDKTLEVKIAPVKDSFLMADKAAELIEYKEAVRINHEVEPMQSPIISHSPIESDKKNILPSSFSDEIQSLQLLHNSMILPALQSQEQLTNLKNTPKLLVGYEAFREIFREASINKFWTFVKIYKPSNATNSLRVCLDLTKGYQDWPISRIKNKIQAIPLFELRNLLLTWKNGAEQVKSKAVFTSKKHGLIRKRGTLAERGLDFLKEYEDCIRKVMLENLLVEDSSGLIHLRKTLPTADMEDYKTLIKLSTSRRFKNKRGHNQKEIWLPDGYQDFSFAKVQEVLNSITRSEVDRIFPKLEINSEKTRNRENLRRQAENVLNKPEIKNYLITCNSWKEADFDSNTWGVDRPIGFIRNNKINYNPSPQKRKKKRKNPPAGDLIISDNISALNRFEESSSTTSNFLLQNWPNPYAPMSVMPYTIDPMTFLLPAIPATTFSSSSLNFPMLDLSSWTAPDFPPSLLPAQSSSFLPNMTCPLEVPQLSMSSSEISAPLSFLQSWPGINSTYSNSYKTTEDQLSSKELPANEEMTKASVVKSKRKVTNRSSSSSQFFKSPRNETYAEKISHTGVVEPSLNTSHLLKNIINSMP